MATVALDIETVSPGSNDGTDVDFLDSRDFEVLCVGLGHRLSPNSEIEIEVIWRPGIHDGDEYQLLAETAEWLHDRHYDRILTYNGTRFDERHLRGRAAIVGDRVGDPSLADVIHQAWEQGIHRDLMFDIIRDRGHRLSLEDAVEQYTRTSPSSVAWEGEEVTNTDIPVLGEEWLAHRSGLTGLGEQGNRLQKTLEAYVRTDIEPLFELADELSNR
ncbi:hypothetical protein [Halobellus sp. EA9]|uniref:hypothetical protein n=1 Tax=Halobellus sp. EA9 TaxID=3421647 RepID=UPI003EC15266